MASRPSGPSPFEYAPAPESRAVVDLRPSYGLFVDGAFVDPADGGSFKTVNPATEEVLAEVAEAGPADPTDPATITPPEVDAEDIEP